MSGFRIQRKVISLALTHGAGATTASAAASYNGLLLEAIIQTPAAVDGAATATVDILDSDSINIYSKGSLAANTTTKDFPANQVPLSGTQTVKVTFSAAQTATDTTTKVILLIDKGL